MIAGDGSSQGFTTARERRRACPGEQAGTAAATTGAAGLAYVRCMGPSEAAAVAAGAPPARPAARPALELG